MHRQTVLAIAHGLLPRRRGYDEIEWDGSAQLVRGTDLEVDNTVLLRHTVGG